MTFIDLIAFLVEKMVLPRLIVQVAISSVRLFLGSFGVPGSIKVLEASSSSSVSFGCSPTRLVPSRLLPLLPAVLAIVLLRVEHVGARECLVAVDAESDNVAVVDATDLAIRAVVRLPDRIAVGCNREARWPGLVATKIDAVRETGVVAVSTGTCVVHLFDARTMRFFDSFNVGHPLERVTVRFSRDGSYLAVGSTLPTSERGGVAIINMETLEVHEVRIEDVGSVRDLVEHPSGELYMLGEVGGLHRVDPLTGESSRAGFDELRFRAIAFSPDARWLYASVTDGDGSGRIVVIEVDSGEIVDSQASRTVASGPSRERVYLRGENLEVVDARTRAQIDEVDLADLPVVSLVFSADESRIFGLVPQVDRTIPFDRVAAFGLEKGDGVRTLRMDGEHCGRLHAEPKISDNPNARCSPAALTVVRCPCPMDCNDDDRVFVSELVTGVRLAQCQVPIVAGFMWTSILSNGSAIACGSATMAVSIAPWMTARPGLVTISGSARRRSFMVL